MHFIRRCDSLIDFRWLHMFWTRSKSTRSMRFSNSIFGKKKHIIKNSGGASMGLSCGEWDCFAFVTCGQLDRRRKNTNRPKSPIQNFGRTTEMATQTKKKETVNITRLNRNVHKLERKWWPYAGSQQTISTIFSSLSSSSSSAASLLLSTVVERPDQWLGLEPLLAAIMLRLEAICCPTAVGRSIFACKKRRRRRRHHRICAVAH